MDLKLNNKRTYLIGFAFFTILMLWQVYNNYCPLFLKDMLINNYGYEQDNCNYIVGLIMAIDNATAIFLIPLFGLFSDKTKTRFGKRMPYIIVGTIAAFIAFPLLAVMFVINSFGWLVAMMVIIVLIMASYRSPAVSLMPDITPKPLRSKANAIINFMGYTGAIIGSVFTMLFVVEKCGNLIILPFVFTAILMISALVLLFVKFKENKIVAEVKPELEAGDQYTETLESVEDDKPISKRDKLNLVIIVGCVAFAYFAFNALETFGSLYGKEVLKTDKWPMTVMVLAVASLAAFLPSIKLTKLIGRKNSVILGLVLIIAVSICGYFINEFNWVLLVLFAISGIGWAILNVNTYPMLVEMASRKNVGRITGIYYIASQSAMAVTSIAVGFVFDWLGLEFFFMYAAIFMSLALVLCLFFKPRKLSKSSK